VGLPVLSFTYGSMYAYVLKYTSRIDAQSNFSLHPENYHSMIEYQDHPRLIHHFPARNSCS
jgi:hypothetical protein